MKKLWKEIQVGRPDERHGPHLRRKRHGQGAHRPGHPRQEPAGQGGVSSRSTAPPSPRSCIESELFGHEKGAFTGATERKTGKFEQADGGTIFLDEIGDMSLKTQSKVLRVLEEGEVQKVGSSKIGKVDVRVIAATNKDLKKEIENETFREDLYFRLNVVPLYSPALREKKEDIPLLDRVFRPELRRGEQLQAQEIQPRSDRGDGELSLEGKRPGAQKRRRAAPDHDRGRTSSRNETCRSNSAAEHRVYLPEPDKVKTLKDFRDLAEKDFILAKLEENGWNISQTAREIDTPRSTCIKSSSSTV